ncbi:MAG: type IV pilus assembly protein PilM [Candidatus Levybacteria bacterium]|nr:type IV pilus assembly protein PilM [Candidatus Levybacteria bacterium]
MKDKPFGLDIGATTMKAVWLSEGKTGFLLKASVVVSTPPKGMLSESPIDQEEMSQAIRNIIGQAKITVSSVNIALPETQVYTKVLEMPVLSDKELSSAIYWEAEQHIPVPLPSITLDYKVLKRPDQGELNGTMTVLLVGAPTMLINKYEKIMAMSGLTINSVETEILSVIRSSQRGQNSPNTLFVNIGAINTFLAIVKDNILVFTYSIPTGGSVINRAIAADFGFTTIQAEEYKKVYGISEKILGGKIGKVTTPIVMSIVSEVKKALSFYSEKYKSESSIQQILLSGGTAKLPGIDAFFAQNCGIETVTANPWKILSDQNVPKEILDNAPDYAVAVGLAMRDYE